MNNEPLRFVQIDQANFLEAVAFQNEIFPHNDGYRNYYESVNGLRDATYYIAYLNEEMVGLCGIYFEPVDLESAWLGWFGVKKAYRRQHLGEKIIAFHEQLARSKGYKYSRLFTDKNDNEVAIAFYKKMGYQEEEYINPDDPISLSMQVLIFSKSLSDEPCPSWDNRTINLTKQVEKERFRLLK